MKKLAYVEWEWLIVYISRIRTVKWIRKILFELFEDWYKTSVIRIVENNSLRLDMIYSMWKVSWIFEWDKITTTLFWVKFVKNYKKVIKTFALK